MPKRPPSKPTSQEAINLLKSYVGKDRSELPWLVGRRHMLDCAAAVSYATGLTAAGKDYINCSQLRTYFQKRKTWITNGVPKPGDVVIFDWSGKRTDTDHAGIVISATKSKVKYVSADSTKPIPGKVSINPGIGYKWITGWGTPTYTTPTAPSLPKPPAIITDPVETLASVKPSKPAAVYVVVKRGDSYWAIASRTLGTKNAVKVLRETRRIQALNNKKSLTAGAKVRIK